jgi:2'-5' RNA ligase
MRLFLAINPPAELRRAIWDAAAPLRDIAPDVAWVPEPKLHLTLKFLGAQPESAVAPLSETLMAVGRSHSVPLVRVGSIGAFPNFRRPRVVWLGVDPEPRLELLHHDVEVACAKLGYELDGRPFRPHLTLGRVRHQLADDDLRTLRATARRVRFTDEFFARSVDLMESVSGPGGSSYTTLVAAPTRGG